MVDIKLALKSFFSFSAMLALVPVASAGGVSLLGPVGAVILLMSAFVVGVFVAAIVFGKPFPLAFKGAVSSGSLTFLDNKFLVALPTC